MTIYSGISVMLFPKERILRLILPYLPPYAVSMYKVQMILTVTGISWFNGGTAGTDSRHSALLDADGALVTGSATGAALFLRVRGRSTRSLRQMG